MIEQQFFPNGSKTAQLNITLKPLTLDTRAETIQFTIGAQEVNYSHGRQTITSITWPLPFTNEDSKVIITDFDGNQFGHHASGPWSLFKVFNYGMFKAGRDTGSYLFEMDFSDYQASFQVSGTSDMNVFTLRNLKGFNLPEAIASSKAEQHTNEDDQS